jgi:hypothetical protein
VSEASFASMEEDEIPCVFENHMQVEENLVEMQILLHKMVILPQSFKVWQHCTSNVSAPNQQEITIYLSSFTWILQEGKKCVVNNSLVAFCWVCIAVCVVSC